VRGQLIRFVVIGTSCALSFAVLYLLLRTIVSPPLANASALAITAVGNTAANRRITFGVRGADSLVKHHCQGMAVFLAGLLATSGSISLLYLTDLRGNRIAEVVTLTAANLCVTVGRFVLMRYWIFPHHRVSADVASGRGRSTCARTRCSVWPIDFFRG
jgi:putative flippase GtrA